MDARVIRAMGAIANSPSVIAGSASWRSAAHASRRLRDDRVHDQEPVRRVAAW